MDAFFSDEYLSEEEENPGGNDVYLAMLQNAEFKRDHKEEEE